MADTVEAVDPPPPPPEEVAVTQPVAQPVTPIPPDAPPPRQGWFAKRSGLEKALIIIVIIVIIILLFMAAAFAVFYFFIQPPFATCGTKECVDAAARLRNYMDETVEPCNNFYEYACGGWLKEQVLDADESEINVGSIIGDANRVKIRGLLEEDTFPGDPVYMTQPKTFYRACMNSEILNDRGTEPFFTVIDKVGKFPTLDTTWNESNYDIDQLVIKLAKLGVYPLVSIAVNRDLKNTSHNRLYIGDAKLGLGSKSKYKEGRDDPRVQHYETWLIENLVLLGGDRATVEKDTKDVVDLEIQISKLMRDSVEKADIAKSYNPARVALLQSNYPWLTWLKVLRALGKNPEEGNIEFENEEVVINTEGKYLEKVGKLLNTTSKRIITNYMMSHLIRFASVLGDEFTAIGDQFVEATMGTAPSPRWERCTTEAVNIFSESISKMYVDRFFKEDAKDTMDVMIKDLRDAFKEILDENTWMTEETKQHAHAKLQLMGSKVGYPDNLDPERLNTLYKYIPVDENEYMETIVATRERDVMENMQKLREKRDKDKWRVHAVTVNAHYDVLANEIIFPAAFLQPPVYSPDYTSSINYGGVGSMIGAEMTKAFGTNGSQYDAKGELKTWWTEADQASFKSRSQCFVDQYGCYKWDGNSISGERTLGENIADNGGLKQSFRAYRNFVRRQGSEEKRLPGLDLNHDQIFFLSFAQVWCAKTRDERKKELVETDVHTPAPYRVYGTLQNSRDFATAFRCPKGSRMNPASQCELW